MRSVSRWGGNIGAVVCVGAAVMMCVASFLPYTGGNWGDGLDAPTLVTINIVGGSDVWFVLGTIAVLCFGAAAHLGNVRRRATGFIALAAALVSLGLALKLPGTWKQDGVVYGEPYLLFTGYYVFLGGAVMAMVGAGLMAGAGFAALLQKSETPLSPAPS
jgi:hypothetical protein